MNAPRHQKYKYYRYCRYCASYGKSPTRRCLQKNDSTPELARVNNGGNWQLEVLLCKPLLFLSLWFIAPALFGNCFIQSGGVYMKIVAISGSLRKASLNSALLEAAKAYFPADAEV